MLMVARINDAPPAMFHPKSEGALRMVQWHRTHAGALKLQHLLLHLHEVDLRRKKIEIEREIRCPHLPFQNL